MPSSHSGSRSHGWPARCTGRIAFVRSPTSSWTRCGSMFRSPSRTSANTGVAPAWTITFAVAGHVTGVVTTSSPGPTPSASSARCIAAVPDATAITWSASRYSAERRSSWADRGPVVSQPDRSVSATAATSSSPTAGGWKPRGRSLRLRDFSPEPRRLVRAFERIVRRLARCEDRARAVRPAAQRTEDVPRAAVDADAVDAFAPVRLLEAADGAKLTLGRDEEADARAVGARRRGEALAHDALAERGVDRERVQIDADRHAAELRVVAAADARGQLADERRPAFRNEHLRVCRPVAHLDRCGSLASGVDRHGDRPRLERARPRVRERHPERGRGGKVPVGNREREERSRDGEGVDRDLCPRDLPLDEQRRRPRGVERAFDRNLEPVRRLDEREAALALAVRRLDDARIAELLCGAPRLVDTAARHELRLRHACLREPLALLELGRAEPRRLRRDRVREREPRRDACGDDVQLASPRGREQPELRRAGA